MTTFWDKLGISASALCILHCLATPILIFSLPVVEQYLSHEMFHVIVAAVVFPVAVIALWSGYRMHRLTRMLWLGGIGLGFLALAMHLEYRHKGTPATIAMVLAGTFLTLAHYLNLKACRVERGARAQGLRIRPHDHSKCATADRRAPDTQQR